jgi:stearoyl-CoA 9-desaturase NADPH oxidoreductase
MNPGLSRPVFSRLGRVADMFAWPLRTSHYLELVNPLWTTHRLRARVVGVWDETATARTLTLRPGRSWRRHRAGQHVRIGVAIGGMQHTRTYSISSPPERDDGCITITVKAAPGGRVSSHLARDVAPGAFLPLGLPQGDFVLPDAVPMLPLFITAGSGITPVMSMLRSYAARGGLPSIVHLHYAPHPYDVIFGGELDRLASDHQRYRLHRIFTRDLGESQSGTRRFTARQLAELCPDWRERDAYACGPQGLLAALERHWDEAGLRRRLHIERFHAPWAEPPASIAGGVVRFARSDVGVETNGRTNLLRIAEDAGLNPPHGCRMGICHSCDTRLVSGCVRDLRTGAVMNEPGETIQICVNAAVGNVELDL